LRTFLLAWFDWRPGWRYFISQTTSTRLVLPVETTAGASPRQGGVAGEDQLRSWAMWQRGRAAVVARLAVANYRQV
jgi:hypothetical protein